MADTIGITRDAAHAFLIDLAAISEKHGIAIGSCGFGCCSSPCLKPVADIARPFAYAVEADLDCLRAKHLGDDEGGFWSRAEIRSDE